MDITATGTLQKEAADRKFIAGVYGWMSLALIISGASAFFTAQSSTMRRFIYGNPIVLLGLVIAELALVMGLTWGIRKISARTAALAFLAYSLLNGIMLSSILIVYTGSSVFRAFLSAALMFGGMSLYGLKTERNLMSAGRYLTMGLIGIIVASLVNFLFRSSMMDWFISLATVIVFTGLTAYDTQKMLKVSARSDGSDMFKRAAIITSLELYLDFINIFLALLRLFGKKK